MIQPKQKLPSTSENGCMSLHNVASLFHAFSSVDSASLYAPMNDEKNTKGW
jgi:hypothetical protein